MRTEAATVESQGPRHWALWRRPPGWLFHLVVAGAMAALLWGFSTPLAEVGSAGIAVLVLLVAALVWLVRVVAFRHAARRERAEGWEWWLVVAPVGLVLTLLLVVADLPLRARWALSEGAFDEAVADFRREGDDKRFVDRRIGLYDVSYIWTEGDAVLFTEVSGGFILRSGGFAYLPDGPDGVAPHLEFQHLSGSWYAWT